MIEENLRKTGWNPINKPKSFYYSIHPLLIISRCLGLCSFSIVLSPFGEAVQLKIHFFDMLWFLSCNLVCVFFVCFDILETITEFQIESLYLTVLSERLLLITGLAMCAVNIVMNMINRNKILWNFEQFAAFDKEVIPLAVLFSYFYRKHQTNWKKIK